MRQLSFSSQVIILISLLSVNNLFLKAQERKLEIDDYFKLKSVQDPQISPDGEWL